MKENDFEKFNLEGGFETPGQIETEIKETESDFQELLGLQLKIEEGNLRVLKDAYEKGDLTDSMIEEMKTREKNPEGFAREKLAKTISDFEKYSPEHLERQYKLYDRQAKAMAEALKKDRIEKGWEDTVRQQMLFNKRDALITETLLRLREQNRFHS